MFHRKLKKSWSMKDYWVRWRKNNSCGIWEKHLKIFILKKLWSKTDVPKLKLKKYVKDSSKKESQWDQEVEVRMQNTQTEEEQMRDQTSENLKIIIYSTFKLRVLALKTFIIDSNLDLPVDNYHLLKIIS